ncbi:unnamed protein product [Allacma fusca]|uniref:Uncharacterized protein n=1 Tax=Allacma fusca TaxID=39272 RepID=A0A8J2KLV6_9HEXA|nr:unnamed protein product [Allacma fusca]
MHFVSYYCVQVLVLLACQLDFSYSVPIRPPSHFDLLIDPLHQSELEDLESKKIVPKSVLNVPYITPVQTVPSCPPGQTRLSGGPCVQRVVSTGLSDDQSLVAQLTKQYFKRKQPPKRQRHPTVRTTTQEPVPTTEVVTESSVSSKDLAATTAWTTASPTLTSTPKSQQEQAFTGKDNSSYNSSSVETDRDRSHNDIRKTDGYTDIF